MKKLINPKELYDAKAFGMSQAVLYTRENLVFVSGQVDWGLDFKTTEKTFEGQLKKALANLKIVLDASNSSVDLLLSIRIYVRGELGDYMGAAVPLLASFFGESRPAVTGIGEASLASPETLVEIEAIAAAKETEMQ